MEFTIYQNPIMKGQMTIESNDGIQLVLFTAQFENDEQLNQFVELIMTKLNS
jgi:hypothetical protein